MTFVCFDSTVGGAWSCASQTPPPPPPGMLQALVDRAAHGPVYVRSARLGRRNGLYAIDRWLRRHLEEEFGERSREVALSIRFDDGRSA